VQIEEDKQDARNWLLALKFDKPVEAYEEMTTAIEIALDPEYDIENLPQDVQDWLRKT
jgi:hypothetical protein